MRRWEKDTRYYEAHLHQDLWDGWVLTHVWGRRGTRLGRIRQLPCASYAEGLKHFTVSGVGHQIAMIGSEVSAGTARVLRRARFVAMAGSSGYATNQVR